jgi:hypothetical protein
MYFKDFPGPINQLQNRSWKDAFYLLGCDAELVQYSAMASYHRKTALFIITAMITSNLTDLENLLY